MTQQVESMFVIQGPVSPPSEVIGYLTEGKPNDTPEMFARYRFLEIRSIFAGDKLDPRIAVFFDFEECLTFALDWLLWTTENKRVRLGRRDIRIVEYRRRWELLGTATLEESMHYSKHFKEI